MLVVNNKPCPIGIGGIILKSGTNNVSTQEWDERAKGRYKKAIEGMAKEGHIDILDKREKLTIDLVKKTYDLDLLREWEADPAHKGPLKGAIREQLALADLDVVGEDKEI